MLAVLGPAVRRFEVQPCERLENPFEVKRRTGKTLLVTPKSFQKVSKSAVFEPKFDKRTLIVGELDFFCPVFHQIAL